MSTYVGVEISPETATRPVFTRVSQATRPYGSSARTASSTPSEIWSATLSGWPSVTDSDVKRYSFSGSVLMEWKGLSPKSSRPRQPFRAAGSRGCGAGRPGRRGTARLRASPLPSRRGSTRPGARNSTGTTRPDPDPDTSRSAGDDGRRSVERRAAARQSRGRGSPLPALVEVDDERNALEAVALPQPVLEEVRVVAGDPRARVHLDGEARGALTG